MKLYKLHITLFIIITSFSALQAQENIPETNFYHYADDPTNRIAIDSGLDNMEAYNFMQGDNWESFNLGNTGQAHQYLALDWNDKVGFKNGHTHFDLYKYHRNTIKYYNIEKPLSEINYFMGSKRENVFGAKFAHNLKNRLQYGLNFHRIASNGVYQNMRTRNGNFSLYSIFSSKNSRYNLAIDMVFSKIKSEENGGLNEDFINDPSLLEGNKEFYTPKITEGITEHKNFEVWFTNSYHFGYSRTDSINDSLSIRKFLPTFSFNHSLGIQKNTFEFVDKAADSTYYNDFIQEVDSTYYRLYYHQIANKLSLSYSGLKKGLDTIKYRNFSGEIGIQHDNIELWQNRNEFTTNNLHLFINIQSNENSLKSWTYNLDAYYFLAGYNQNDWKVDGSFAYDLKKYGKAQVSASIEQQEASWIENSFYSSTLTWDNDFLKKTRTKFAFDYWHNKAQIRLHAEYSILGNFIYFDNDSKPNQLDKTTHYWQAYAAKDLHFKILHFDNFIGVQGNNNQDALRLPSLFLKSSLYMEGFLFKGNMLARFGVDLRYNTNFIANAWQPLTGQFHLQNQENMKYTPVLDIFLSFKVKTLRVFAKANYINEGLGQKNYFTALGYPDRGRTFAGGLIWRFFE